MPARITYVYHNCFLLRCCGLTILFDYPAPEHRTEQAEALVREQIRDQDLVVFFSHSHADHFTPEVLEFEHLARSVRYVVSYDVPDMYPEFEPDGTREILVLDPDDTEPAVLPTAEGEMRFTAFESTDLGVGARIATPRSIIWFGGDVACWDWEGLDERNREFSRKQFQEVLHLLAAERVDIAFSNTDKRLVNWTGGIDFVRVVAPRVFVPMHTFGKTEWVWEFAAELGESSSKLFLYASTGDAMEVRL